MNSESYYGGAKGPTMAQSFQQQQHHPVVSSESNYHQSWQQPVLTSPPVPPIRNYENVMMAAPAQDEGLVYTNLLGGSHVNYNGTYYSGELIDLSASQLHQQQQAPVAANANQYHPQSTQQHQHNDMYNADIDFMNNYLKSLPDYTVPCPSSTAAAPPQSQTTNTVAATATAPHIKSENYRHHYVNDPFFQYYDSATAMQGYYPIAKSSSYHAYSSIPTSNAGSSSAAGGHPSYYHQHQQNQPGSRHYQQYQFQPPLPHHHHHHHHHQQQQHPPDKLPRSTSHSLIPRASADNKYSIAANKSRATPSDNGSSLAYVPKQSTMSKFWQDTTSSKQPSGPAKFGWNYDRIMAKTKKDVQNSINEYKKNVTSLHNLYSSADGGESHIPEANNHFKLRKNYSYSHLDKHIRDHLTEEEFQKLVNESESKPNFYSNHSCNFVNPLCKSYSSGAMSFGQSFLPPPRPLPQPPQSNLAKSNSNASLLRKPSITGLPDVAALLAKSNSSSCIYTKALNQPNSKKYNLFTPYKSIIPEPPPGIPSLPPNDISATNKMISKNNALIKKSASFNPFGPPSSRKGTVDSFFVKQHIPPASKVIVDYPPFTKISSIQIPINGHLPPAFPTPRDFNNNQDPNQHCIINIEDNIEQSIADIYNIGCTYPEPQLPQPTVFKSYSHSRLNPDAKNFTPSRSLCEQPSSTSQAPPLNSLARSNSNSCNVTIGQNGKLEPIPVTSIFNSTVEVTPTYVPAKGITLSKSATQIASYGDESLEDEDDTVVPCASDLDDDDDDDEGYDLNYEDDEHEDTGPEDDPYDQYFVPSSASKSLSAKVGEPSSSSASSSHAPHTNTPQQPKTEPPRIFTSNADIFLETDETGTGADPTEEFLLDEVQDTELYAFPTSDSTDSCSPEHGIGAVAEVDGATAAGAAVTAEDTEVALELDALQRLTTTRHHSFSPSHAAV